MVRLEQVVSRLHSAKPPVRDPQSGGRYLGRHLPTRAESAGGPPGEIRGGLRRFWGPKNPGRQDPKGRDPCSAHPTTSERAIEAPCSLPPTGRDHGSGSPGAAVNRMALPERFDSFHVPPRERRHETQTHDAHPHGRLAQLVERQTFNLDDAGSSPVLPTCGSLAPRRCSGLLTRRAEFNSRATHDDNTGLAKW